MKDYFKYKKQTKQTSSVIIQGNVGKQSSTASGNS
jgi:hypothetical protein